MTIQNPTLDNPIIVKTDEINESCCYTAFIQVGDKESDSLEVIKVDITYDTESYLFDIETNVFNEHREIEFITGLSRACQLIQEPFLHTLNTY